ncbi:MAG: B12-binding domain-containing radical SAM protein [Elusimicrobia bacterium]|nr:B12-binding domain-containing radical SAM protein [Elusimicrobiota bacterium]MBU2614132.1 B12-binding domain-containing radical SAM protein [Elusimicrobiota bacterium]
MAKVLFICAGCEHLGIEYISSMLKKHNHQVDLFLVPILPEDSFFNVKLVQKNYKYSDFKKKIIERIQNHPPDIIAFSAVTDFYRYGCDIAKDIKAQIDIPIIFGGIHPTTVPDIVINEPFIDIICVGEGEFAMLELMNRIEEYKKEKTLQINNLWFKKNGVVTKNPTSDLVEDLDEFPLPDKQLFYDRMPSFRRQFNINSTRGCPFGCTYCCNNILRAIYKEKGKYLRKRSVENVLLELEQNVTKDTKLIFFRDEVFPYNKVWMREFAEKYPKRIGIPYKLFIHPRMCTQETTQLLAQSGCIYVSMGVQSGFEETRKKYLKRIDTNDEIAAAVKNLKKAGIRVNIDHIAGVPGEGENEMVQTAIFYNDFRPNVVTYFWMTLYPNTEIVSIYKSLSLITDKEIGRINHGELQSDFLGGSVSFNQQLFYQFRTFLCYLPLIPKWFFSLLIKWKVYKYVNIKSRFFSSLFPRLLLAPFNRDVRAWKVEIGDWLERMSYFKKFMRDEV